MRLAASSDLPCRCLLAALIFLAVTPLLTHGQSNVTGKWTTLSYTTPINPVHAALLSTGKILIVAGSGSCPPYLSGCPAGPPYGPANKSGAELYDPVAGTSSSTPCRGTCSATPWSFFPMDDRSSSGARNHTARKVIRCSRA